MGKEQTFLRDGRWLTMSQVKALQNETVAEVVEDEIVADVAEELIIPAEAEELVEEPAPTSKKLVTKKTNKKK